LEKSGTPYTAANMNKHHQVEDIQFSRDVVSMTIDRKEYSFELKKISEKLLGATALERSTYRISVSGYGIHWQLIDEDLSIDGLLGIVHMPRFIAKATEAEN